MIEGTLDISTPPYATLEVTEPSILDLAYNANGDISFDSTYLSVSKMWIPTGTNNLESNPSGVPDIFFNFNSNGDMQPIPIPS